MYQWYTSTGKLIYDPPRGNMKDRTHWWCILQIDREITRYYRWWVKKQYWIDLCQPSWDAHVSVIRGEKPFDDQVHLWKEDHGKIFQFKYCNKIINEGHFWLLEVDAPELIGIRKRFNKPTNWPLHITFGRTWY